MEKFDCHNTLRSYTGFAQQTQAENSMDDNTQESGNDLEGENSIFNKNNENVVLTDMGSSFAAEFSDGYSFRNMIEYLRATNLKGAFRFSKDQIVYEQSDENDTICNKIDIATCELTYYEFNSRTDEIIIGVNISDMRVITKTIGRKDSVRLYKKPTEQLLYIETSSHSTRGIGRQIVNVVRPITDISVIEYVMPEYSVHEKFPNCTVQMADFAKTCTSMGSLKCSFVTIHGLPKGAIFEGMTEGSMSGRIERFGIDEEYIPTTQSVNDSSRYNFKLSMPTGPKPRLVVKNEIAPLVKIKVKMCTVKALAKLNNLSSAGIIKFYMEANNPLKLVCRIGAYGTLRVFIQSDDNC